MSEELFYDIYYSQLSVDKKNDYWSCLTLKGERVSYTEMVKKGVTPYSAKKWNDLKHVGISKSDKWSRLEGFRTERCRIIYSGTVR